VKSNVLDSSRLSRRGTPRPDALKWSGGGILDFIERTSVLNVWATGLQEGLFSSKWDFETSFVIQHASLLVQKNQKEKTRNAKYRMEQGDMGRCLRLEEQRQRMVWTLGWL
jgi:hypothetical protein